jgi:CarD-like/TRCF domain.
MFEIGEYIIYGNHGVCRVEGIGNLDLPGIDKSRKCYTLQPVFSKSSTLYTPVDNDKVLMRKVMSNEEAMELLEKVPEIPVLWIGNEKQREEVYRDALKSHDGTDWIKIIKTLYVRRRERMSHGKKLTYTDEKYLNIAKNCLYGELAIALDIEKDKVEDLINERLEQLNLV